MTIEEAIKFVAGLLAADKNALLFTGDLDEFGSNAVDDTDGKRCAVWVNYTAHNCKSEHSLARFRTFEEADAFVAALVAATGVGDGDRLAIERANQGPVDY
ncbi:MAG: hypothetical protein EBZ69_00925 [Alphaproteobacteria bacterium]|nr:hypothetical protein [Alphaproteobacteria bacterium]NDG04787.1 hypothetical protein [Alphaproteobacteria bacterium]